MIKTILLTLVIMLTGLVANGTDCKVDCPKGYLGVCVEVDGHGCSCRCAKDARGGSSVMQELLREKAASDGVIEEATRKFERMAARGKDFTFDVSDRDRVFTVEVKTGEEDNSRPR